VFAVKIISVSYGHGTSDGNGGFSASGKLYDYSTDKQYRAGDVVVVPVEQWKSKKLYHTLAVVRLTNNADSPGGMAKLDNLTDPKKGISPKDVGMRLEIAKKSGLKVDNDRQVNISTLPGYDTRLSGAKWSQRVEQSPPRLISRTTNRGG
jgi:hypothetical protein